MKSIYERTLGRKDIEVLHNGAEQVCSELALPRPEPFTENNPFVLCFIGGLFSYLHGDCIEDLFEAISQIRNKYPWFEFHLYGQRQPTDFLEDLIQTDGITHHGIVMPLNKKFDIMEKLTCFVIPSSFNDQNHSHYRYSFPTKLPELIATGRPILSYGPKETSTNRILEANSIGLRLNDRSVPKLVDALENLVTKYEDCVSQFAAASPTLIEKFSANSVRRKLKNSFLKLKFLWSNLLKIPIFRRAMLAHLRLQYFHEFHHSIPLGNNYWAHLWENDAYDSFFGNIYPTRIFRFYTQRTTDQNS